MKKPRKLKSGTIITPIEWPEKIVYRNRPGVEWFLTSVIAMIASFLLGGGIVKSRCEQMAHAIADAGMIREGVQATIISSSPTLSGQMYIDEEATNWKLKCRTAWHVLKDHRNTFGAQEAFQILDREKIQ